MSDAPDDSIRSLLPADYGQLDDQLRRQIGAAPEFAKKELPGFVWNMIGKKATQALDDTLDLNVFGVFARAWCKGVEIRRAARQSLAHPGMPFTLLLGKHKANTSLLPAVDITILPFATHRIPFELALAAEFESVELTLRDGAIASIGAGTCRVVAQLKCAGEPMHPAKPSQKVKLGAPHALKPPIVVATVDEAEPFHEP